MKAGIAAPVITVLLAGTLGWVVQSAEPLAGAHLLDACRQFAGAAVESLSPWGGRYASSDALATAAGVGMLVLMIAKATRR